MTVTSTNPLGAAVDLEELKELVAKMLADGVNVALRETPGFTAVSEGDILRSASQPASHTQPPDLLEKQRLAARAEGAHGGVARMEGVLEFLREMLDSMLGMIAAIFRKGTNSAGQGAPHAEGGPGEKVSGNLAHKSDSKSAGMNAKPTPAPAAKPVTASAKSGDVSEPAKTPSPGAPVLVGGDSENNFLTAFVDAHAQYEAASAEFKTLIEEHFVKVGNRDLQAALSDEQVGRAYQNREALVAVLTPVAIAFQELAQTSKDAGRWSALEERLGGPEKLAIALKTCDELLGRNVVDTYLDETSAKPEPVNVQRDSVGDGVVVQMAKRRFGPLNQTSAAPVDVMPLAPTDSTAPAPSVPAAPARRPFADAATRVLSSEMEFPVFDDEGEEGEHPRESMR